MKKPELKDHYDPDAEGKNFYDKCDWLAYGRARQKYENWKQRISESLKGRPSKMKSPTGRWCFWHRREDNLVPAIAYYTMKADNGYKCHCCADCLRRFVSNQKITYLEGCTKDDGLPNLDPKCNHQWRKKNLVTEGDADGSYDLIECIHCKGQYKRRGLG